MIAVVKTQEEPPGKNSRSLSFIKDVSPVDDDEMTANGWEIYGVFDLHTSNARITFNCGVSFVKYTYDDVWVDLDERSISLVVIDQGLKTSDVKLVHEQGEHITMADQIVFDQMWPRYVKLFQTTPSNVNIYNTSKCEAVIEAKSIRERRVGDSSDTNISLVWVREESLRSAPAEADEDVAGDGWELSAIVQSRNYKKSHAQVRVAFASGTMAKEGDFPWSEASFAESRSAFIFVNPWHSTDLSEIEFLPIFGEISISDRIIFEKMWPRFVRLYRSKKPISSERTVKL